MRKAKKYEELTIIDDFMFGKVMRDPKRCKRLLEIILGVRIRRVELVENQESLNPDYEAKGIRLDVYVEDSENTVYNVEMQARNTGCLPQRSRYYQDVIDINLLEKGASYKALRKNVVIFICSFDLFDRGRHVYHFENLCREDPSLRLVDGTEKIFLNTKGTMEDADEDLRNLLAYFDNQVPTDAFTRELEDAVVRAKVHKEWRSEYMKLTLWQQDMLDEGRQEGMEQGRQEGLEQGMEQGIKQGRQEGVTIKSITSICKKHRKGLSVEEAADMLEEEEAFVRVIYALADKCAPDYDVENIYKKYMEQRSS